MKSMITEVRPVTTKINNKEVKLMEIKVYVNNNTTKEGKEYTSYSSKIKATNEWVTIRFSNKVENKPEVNSKVSLDNKDIFEVKDEGSKRRTFVIMNVTSIEPLERKIIEDDFFA